MSQITDCNCILCQLSVKRFRDRSHEEQVLIVSNGRPTPPLPSLYRVIRERDREYTRRFTLQYYEKIKWLSGCSVQNKMFCFPCVLFNPDFGKKLWVSGNDNIISFFKDVKKHSKSRLHLTSSISLTAFIQKHVLRSQLIAAPDPTIAFHNETVRRNRLAMRRVIDSLLFVAKQCPFVSDSVESNLSELLDIFGQDDPSFESLLKSPTIYRCISSPDVLNKLVSSISDVILDAIKTESSKASFVSVMLDEMSEVTGKSQLSTVLRYLNDKGVPCERFIGFVDLSDNHSPSTLLEHLKGVINMFDLDAKFLALSCNGSAVTSGELSVFLQRALESFPKLKFLPCHHGYSFTDILRQSVSCIHEAGRFFRSLTEMSSFFASSARFEKLESHAQKRCPNLTSSSLNFTSRLIHSVKNCRLLLIDFFEFMIDTGGWESADIIMCRGFLQFLNDFTNIYLLEVFSSIFHFSDKINLVLDTCIVQEFTLCQIEISSFKDNLSRLKSSGFVGIWSKVESFHQGCTPPKRRFEDDKFRLQRLFNEIIDRTIQETQVRFKEFEKLSFMSALSKLYYTRLKSAPPEVVFRELLHNLVICREKINVNDLGNEIAAYFLDNTLGFQNKKTHEVCANMVGLSVNDYLPELFKLFRMILTVPVSETSDKSMTTLQRIKSLVHSSQGQQRFADLSTIFVEHMFLMELKSKSNDELYNCILDKFSEVAGMPELKFK